jgi:hypothetical protein
MGKSKRKNVELVTKKPKKRLEAICLKFKFKRGYVLIVVRQPFKLKRTLIRSARAKKKI